MARVEDALRRAAFTVVLVGQRQVPRQVFAGKERCSNGIFCRVFSRVFISLGFFLVFFLVFFLGFCWIFMP